MNRIFLLFVSLFVGLSQSLAAQHDMKGMPDLPPAATLEKGMGHLHHPVSTKNAEAQRFFDQGLTLVYAFNHDEAIKSFTRAADLDPSLAMAYWGVALALGPNINLDVDPDREKAAFNAVQQAKKNAASASENERAYIEALSRRYSLADKADLHQLASDYSRAMGELAARYPDDLDASVLYAESMMDLRPWALWTNDGKPVEGTEKIVNVLEGVLKRDPEHIGANHYYIHAMEASPHPERALMSARRMESLVPAAGHLVHMPAHIYMRTGNYEGAVKSNADAAAIDREFIRSHGPGGVYPLMYYNHNVSFLSAAESMAGNFAGALKSAQELVANTALISKEMAMIEPFTATADLVLVRFRKWDEILKTSEPHYGPASNTFWHFARGMALAGTGDAAGARSELAVVRKGTSDIPGDSLIGLNNSRSVLAVAAAVLEARIARTEKNSEGEIAALRQAVAGEDGLSYDEPSDWFYPVRESLGGALLVAGRNAEAEKVFREDLERNPGNGRSLYGLAESLRRQNKSAAAEMVTMELERAWKNADTKLSVENL